jgi:DNA-binding transcriptional LysR family regulator
MAGPPVDLQQIRYFLTLARTLNFTRAAQECNITQPALTKSIQRLEEILDGQLIYRQRSHTQLTPFGQAILPLLEQTFSSAEAARGLASMFHRQDGVILRLGTAPEVASGLLVPVLRELRGRIAGLDLAWQVAGREVLVERMVEGALDVAILTEPDRLPDSLHRWPLFAERYVVLCPGDHALAGEAEIPVDRLQAERLLLSDHPDGEYQSVLAASGAFEVEAMRFSRLACPEAQIAELVLAGFGLTISTESRCPPAGLVARPIEPPWPLRTVLLVAPAGRRRPVAADAFIKLLRAQRIGAGPAEADAISISDS